MKRTVEAVFEGGVFRPVRRPDLPEGECVRLTVESVGQFDPTDVAELATRVYEGLSPKDVQEIEAMARRRPVFNDARILPTSSRGQRQLSAREVPGRQMAKGTKKTDKRDLSVEPAKVYQLKVTLMVLGYYETLECLRDPGHEEYEQTKTWIEGMTGGPFDPDVFELEAVNRALQAFR